MGLAKIPDSLELEEASIHLQTQQKATGESTPTIVSEPCFRSWDILFALDANVARHQFESSFGKQRLLAARILLRNPSWRQICARPPRDLDRPTRQENAANYRTD